MSDEKYEGAELPESLKHLAEHMMIDLLNMARQHRSREMKRHEFALSLSMSFDGNTMRVGDFVLRRLGRCCDEHNLEV